MRSSRPQTRGRTVDSAGVNGEEARIRVKVPEMPPEDLAAVAREIEPVLRDLDAWLRDGHVSGPVALVVSDSRYPMLPRLADLEEREVVFYDRDAGYAKLISREQEGEDGS